MPCFDPKNVVFITNKWDSINQDESDSDEEDEETRTWKKTLADIKSAWPYVIEKNIFRMSLKEVHHKDLYYYMNNVIQVKNHKADVNSTG